MITSGTLSIIRARCIQCGVRNNIGLSPEPFDYNIEQLIKRVAEQRILDRTYICQECEEKKADVKD
jgi:hypothetical protein